jgi:hypothetical protein
MASAASSAGLTTYAKAMVVAVALAEAEGPPPGARIAQLPKAGRIGRPYGRV